jgi:hypothetical protein
LALLAVVLLLLLTACTGAGAGADPDGVASLVDPSAAPSASPAASLDPEAAMEAFTDCMREHGVDVQTSAVDEAGGSGNGPVKNVTIGRGADKTGTDIKDFEAAQKACASLLPKGGTNGPGAAIDPEFEQKMLDFAKCMRDHGIDMPDPQFSSTGGGGKVTIGTPGDGGGIDPESKSFQDAQKACESLMPSKLDGGLQAAPATKP